jgi:NAD-dependent dihydropyrimidine dehydrogenase PreA subunit
MAIHARARLRCLHAHPCVSVCPNHVLHVVQRVTRLIYKELACNTLPNTRYNVLHP